MLISEAVLSRIEKLAFRNTNTTRKNKWTLKIRYLFTLRFLKEGFIVNNIRETIW